MGGVVWHAPHALPVFYAAAGFAIACPDTAIIIATAIDNTVAAPAARAITALIDFGSRMLALLNLRRRIRRSPE